MPFNANRPPMTTRRLAELLAERRDNDIALSIPALDIDARITGVAYRPVTDQFVVLVDEDEVCLAGFCYEDPNTPGRCPHGFTAFKGDTSDASANLRYLHPVQREQPDDWGDGHPQDYVALYTATGYLLRPAFRHAFTARADLPYMKDSNSCCPKCCDQCRPLAFYADRALSPAQEAIRCINAAGEPVDPLFQDPDTGLIRWTELDQVWADADLLGCHRPGE